MSMGFNFKSTHYRGAITAACFVGGLICLGVFIFALAWEAARAWKRTAYQRAMRRYESAQADLRAAWRA
jgi:hypothetical protein